jgi:hypothetical protein
VTQRGEADVEAAMRAQCAGMSLDVARERFWRIGWLERHPLVVNARPKNSTFGLVTSAVFLRPAHRQVY